MKRLEISKLMDEYQDNEFFPEEGTFANAQRVKDRVLSQTIPVKRWQMPSLKTALLAAVLAVGCVFMIAAGLPMKAYRLLSGDSIVIQTDANNGYLYIGWQGDAVPIVLEDGRLWLVLENERTDVTDLIDEDTPYIVEGIDLESGLKNYLIVGGTPEDYGWQVWFEMPLGGYNGGGWNTCTNYCKIDGTLVEYNEWRKSSPCADGEPVPTELLPEMVVVSKSWLDSANAQLGLWN